MKKDKIVIIIDTIIVTVISSQYNFPILNHYFNISGFSKYIFIGIIGGIIGGILFYPINYLINKFFYEKK